MIISLLNRVSNNTAHLGDRVPLNRADLKLPVKSIEVLKALESNED